MNYGIEKYSHESGIPESVSVQLPTLLKRNIPDCYSEASKRRNIERVDTPQKVMQLLQAGGAIFVAQDTKERALGFLEIRNIELPQGIYIQMSWLIIDTLARGQGIASELHQRFETEARERGAGFKKLWCLQLATALGNTSAQAIYHKWGYEEYKREGNDVFMLKDLVGHQ